MFIEFDVNNHVQVTRLQILLSTALLEILNAPASKRSGTELYLPPSQQSRQHAYRFVN